MAKLIGLDGRMLSDLYMEGVSALKCALWRPDTIRKEAVYRRLKSYGVSLSSLNLRLYSFGIPNRVGRFPELFDVNQLSVDIIHNHLDEFERKDNNASGDLSVKLARDIALEIADYLAYSLRTFERYRLAGSKT